MNVGKIIVLNGIPSAGKSSIVKALQDTLDEPYLDTGLDKYIGMLPKRYHTKALWNEVLGLAEPGELGHRLISGMHHAIAALARADINIVADHVLWKEQWLQECANLFGDWPAFFIGVHCPLEVAEYREKERSNRTIGQARERFYTVHAHGIYDFEVDTSISNHQNCALQIKQRLKSGIPPFAFKRLKYQR